LKEVDHDFLEDKNELPEERAVSCYNNCLIDLAILVDVTSHLNHQSPEYEAVGKEQIVDGLVNDIIEFKMKL